MNMQTQPTLMTDGNKAASNGNRISETLTKARGNERANTTTTPTSPEQDLAAMLKQLREENAKLRAQAESKGAKVEASYADGYLTVKIPVGPEGKTSSTGKSLVFGTVAGRTGVNMEGVGELRVTASVYVKV